MTFVVISVRQGTRSWCPPCLSGLAFMPFVVIAP
jgi:hypothetical protein